MKHRILAGALSLFVPGLGQFYHLQYKLGLLLIFIQSVLFGYSWYGAFITGGLSLLLHGPLLIGIQLIGSILAIFFTRVEKKSLFYLLNQKTAIRLIIGLSIVILTHSVAFMIAKPPTMSANQEKQLQEAVIHYLEEKYDESFLVSDISTSYEPYSTTAYIKAHPISNQEVFIHLTGDFTTLEVYEDNYQSGLWSYEITNYLEKKGSDIFTDQTLLVSASVYSQKEDASIVSFFDMKNIDTDEIGSINVNFLMFDEIIDENITELQVKLFEMILFMQELGIEDPELRRSVSWDVFSKSIQSDEAIMYYKEYGYASFRGAYSDYNQYTSVFYDWNIINSPEDIPLTRD